MANMLTTSGGTILQVGMTFNTQKAKVQLTRDLSQLEQKSKIQIPVEVDGTRFVKTVKTFQDSMKNLVEVTTMYSGATGTSVDSISKLSTGLERAEKAIKEQEQATQKLNNSQQRLNTTAKQSKDIFQDFADTFVKMAKFNTVNLIYDGLIDSIHQSIEITNEFNATMTEFKKVTDTTNLSLKDYTTTLGEYGSEVARTTTEMLKSATEFSKSGFSPEDSARLAQIASLYQNIADAEISSGDAASFIISQMKAFNIEADNATSILDKINEVSNNFAVSSSDISSALTKQSASLAAYGNGLDESIALVTAGSEIMTKQSGKVARGLRTIGANITQLAQSSKEFDVQVNGAVKSIKLWNDAGTDMLNTYDVLKQIAEVWDEMSNAEKSSLAITLAKKTQMDTFLAVLGNFKDAENAYVTSLMSEGSALKENTQYMQSIEAHQQRLKAEWEKLVLSAPFEDLEKAILNVGTAILKFANSDVGQTIIKTTALVAAFLLLTKTTQIFYDLLSSKSAVSIFASAITSLIAGETTLTQVTLGLTKVMLSNPLFWGAAAIVGISLLVKGISRFIVTTEEATEALKKINKEVDDTQNNITSLEDKINDIGKAIENINQKKLSVTDENELNKLQLQTNELIRQEAILKNQLAIEKQKLETQQKQQAAAAKKAMSGTTATQVYDLSRQDDRVTELDYITKKSNVEAARLLIEQMTEAQKQINACREAMQGLGTDTAEYQEQLKRQNDLIEVYDNLNAQLQPLIESSEQIIEAGADEQGIYQGIIDSLIQLQEVKEEVQATGGIASEEDIENLEAEEGAIQSFNEQVGEYIGNLQNVQSAYDTMIGAIQEYNENGYYTADTLANLNSLTSEQLSILAEQGTSIEGVTDAMIAQYNVEKEDIVMKLELAKYADLVALSEQYLATETEGASGAIVAGGNTASANASKYIELANAAKQAADAMHQVQSALGMDSNAYQKFKSDRDAIVKQYDDTIKAVKKSQLDLNKAINSGGGGGGGSRKGGGGKRSGGGGGKRSGSGKSAAEKAAKEHEDAWLEAFKNEQKALKHKLEMDEITQYEYYQRLKELNEKYFGEISGNHEKYVKEYQENEEEIYKGLKSVYDKVKNYLQKAVEQGYEKAINALEKEEKTVLAGIKRKIDSLKKEKDGVLDGIQKEIDTLKKEEDVVLDGIKKETEMLKKQKDEVEKYWNDQIDALKRENEEIQEQNQLLEYQQALQQAKAQKVMVYQDGKFQLSENESAIAEAEKALAEYEDQLSYEQQIRRMEDLRDTQLETLEERINALEEYYEYMEEYYDKQIEALEEYYTYMEEYYNRQIEAMEEYYDQVEAQYEKQIEALQNQLDAFKEGCEKAEELENAKLAATVLAANEEAAVWQKRLENLASAITEYNRLLSLMGEAGVGAESTFSAGTASFTPSNSVSGVNSVIQTRAKGDSSFARDEVVLVGESPNAELVLGSKLNSSINSGNLVHLSRGSGVVNAESTQTLAGLLNGLSKPTNVSNNRSTQQNFSFGSITLPNVTDADSFVNTLSNKFNNYAIQYGNVRR